MKHVSIGDLEVSRIGLGCMGMSAYYTGAGVDDAESIRTIHRALDLGITLIDTAEIYGPYTNEELVGRALARRRDEVVLATKIGLISHLRGTRGERELDGTREKMEDIRTLDSTPGNIRTAVEGSLKLYEEGPSCQARRQQAGDPTVPQRGGGPAKQLPPLGQRTAPRTGRATRVLPEARRSINR